ncbi:MAG: hypothetical protein Q4Q04_05385 [Methanocorpusculum sp.]|nr:hypothetical protein [Methanocorpusculum sp.]
MERLHDSERWAKTSFRTILYFTGTTSDAVIAASSAKQFSAEEWKIFDEISAFCRQNTAARSPVLYTYAKGSGWIMGQPAPSE